MPADRPTLAVVPVYLREAEELDVVLRCLVSLWTSTDSADTVAMIVDDGSPATELVDQLEVAVGELGYMLHRQPENGGFSRAVNVGLQRALDAEADAVLVNADIEFFQHGWLDHMRARLDTQKQPAAVVGARLLYPTGLIQHGGIYFSLLKRDWFHRFHFGPGDLDQAQVPFRCPVTAALQFIRWETLDQVGLYDEGYRMCFEDVDYCLRVFEAGLECIYEPAAAAYHLEKYFRSKPSPTIQQWTEASTQRLWSRWGDTDLSQFIPEVL